ncbi:MAG: hypothetical protein J5863_03585 [Desulfovibrio sp.]|nr:hypothetical protein [Desulfovibrio sp.]
MALRLQLFHPARSARPARSGSALPALALLCACLLFCRHADAFEFDAITSEPPSQPKQETKQETDIPFFGNPVVVEEDVPKARQAEQPAPKRQEARPRELVPGQPQARQPRAEAKPQRPSGRLEIPEDAARRGDLSFLKGCWYMEKRVSRHDKPGTPYARTIQESICLDGHGGGTFRVHDFDDGWTVSARARARFDGSTLVFEHGDMRFPDGMRFYGSSFQCRGAGVGTSCAKYCPSCRYIPKHRTLRITRTP